MNDATKPLDEARVREIVSQMLASDRVARFAASLDNLVGDYERASPLAVSVLSPEAPCFQRAANAGCAA